ncbi:hypothetical protein BDK51DRAFT_20984 [Blyttiomyces helicus]|uniref:Uncharacterized protein n=1 Tax=Blyttiomyces helicus TaxID=388810 RepID=A0A4P9W333_9FUNG|nr:hypothetical protein BDK51DRAFT_20984 [Blyttiomyces helicus]|eukprot:RKO85238.1 hypothetical protein BDK51DRAFT_20984 [Blyttiomyces helicus]
MSYLASARDILKKNSRHAAAQKSRNPTSSSLDSIVAELTRAVSFPSCSTVRCPRSTPSTQPAYPLVPSSPSSQAVGGSAKDLQGDDLERYVADLIAKEAAASSTRIGRTAAPSTPPANLPKPNKRFLATMIRNTDAHNDALLRKEREEAEGRQVELARRLRALDRKGRRDSRGGRGSDGSDGERQRERKRPPSYSPETATRTFTPNAAPRALRGRGATGSSRLDKYFEPDYNPLLDTDNFDDQSFDHYVSHLEELAQAGGAKDAASTKSKKKQKKEKKKKDKKEKKKKRKKERKSRRSDDEDDSSDGRGSDDGEERRERKRRRRRESGSSDSEAEHDREAAVEGRRSADSVVASGGPRLPASCPW